MSERADLAQSEPTEFEAALEKIEPTAGQYPGQYFSWVADRYVSVFPPYLRITLGADDESGSFTADELEAMARWMRSLQGRAAGGPTRE